ncbi:hypothetical protein F4861DRAFT_451821 [Xylaria intraflava]|nr:hypothetical protein F4861DRAFT_451821 [Xylaria intraflava]
MGTGLDELIESLLNEIAFSGVRGCSVSNLLAAIDSFYKPSDKEDGSRNTNIAIVHGDHVDRRQDAANRNDLAVASKVWKWLVARPDVSIGTNKEFNHLSLEDVLALPEEVELPPLEPIVESSEKPSSTNAKSHARPKSTLSTTAREKIPAVRPRLHVSEERQWRTITGHGPDLKRVPLFEWRALVDIASVKEKGILQGDLVRLTGQDKRSLPTRTDALARKGYVIKQPIVLRGGKSSKLWLAQFSEHAKQSEEREGLDYDLLDLSKQALTSDLYPVPFAAKWNGETIDYLALAQGFMAIVKAWELIRYCDARAKLGVGERVRQMRALAKTCRWLTNIGALSFVGAKFAGSNRLFKDCVKFIRDPSPAEWSHFRATPKTRMVVPSGRIGKRGEASRAAHASQPGASGSKATGKSLNDTASRPPLTRIIPSPWKPQKPLPNSAFEIIKRAGSKGTSNAAICRQTLGYNFRRLTSAMTGSISMPTNAQPSHLKHLSLMSRLSRIGKTMTYTFYANSEIAGDESDEQQQQTWSAENDTAASTSTSGDTTAGHTHNVFSQPDLSRFTSNTAPSLTDISQAEQLNRALTRKRKRSIQEDPDDQPSAKTRRGPGRPRRHPTRNTKSDLGLEPTEEHQNTGSNDTAQQQSAACEQPQQEAPQPVPRPPGVYRGVPNSLDPVPRRGRRPRSLVLIFRSDRLKDPSFLGVSSVDSELPGGDRSRHGDEATNTSTGLAVQSQDANSIDASGRDETQPDISQDTPAQPKAAGSKKSGLYWCKKCGNSWKNSNGLEYHLTKSRTACNPDFVPPSSELINHRKRKFTQRHAVNRSPGPRSVMEDNGHYRVTLTPREQVESRFDVKKRPKSSRSKKPSVGSSLDEGTIATPHTSAASQPSAHQGSVMLKDLEVYDASDYQRPQRQHIMGTNKRASTYKGSSSVEDAQPFSMHGRRQSSVVYPAESRILRFNANKHNEEAGPFNQSPYSTTDAAEYPTDGSPIRTRILPKRKANLSRENPPAISYTGRPSSRKPLPGTSTRPGTSGLPLPKVAMQVYGADVDGTATREPEPSTVQPDHSTITPRPPVNKSLASFARETRPNASSGARRRDRTFQVIEYLLAQNDGVFPGVRSLFMAVVSVWAKEFGDLAPPDRRVCQNAVNQMERNGLLKQMHFYFFDDQAKMKECVVLAKVGIKGSPAVDSCDDPRVIAVKEKMREMYPEAYVPDAFSLSPDEAKLFDELASQGKEQNQTRSLRVPRDLKSVQNIETLRYESSVMGDIPIHRSSTKRLGDEIQAEIQPPPKRPYLDVEQSDSIEKARKPRKRPGKHELWDSGKLAVYIWSQRQKSGAIWDQPRSCLQDPKTGAWSWMPGTSPPQVGRINTILSSVKSAKDIDASLKRKGRKSWADINGSTENDKENQYGHQNSREIPITDADVIMRDRDAYGGPNTRIPRAPPARFGVDSLGSGEYGEDAYGESNRMSGDESIDSYVLGTKTSTRAPDSGEVAAWSGRRGSFPDAQDAASFAATRSIPRTSRQSRGNQPHNVPDTPNSAHPTSPFIWVDASYGEFLENVEAIQKWEQSTEDSQDLTQGTIASDHDYISLTVKKAGAKTKPTDLEWLGANQLTANNMPEEVQNTPSEDEDYGVSSAYDKRSGYKTTRHEMAEKSGSRPKAIPRKSSKGTQNSLSYGPGSPMQHDSFIEYKTRELTFIPRQPRGRFSKPAVHDEKLGAKREDELLAACVVFKTLLGGLDKNLDIGLLLKHFPGISLSAIKKFWPRISRERKSYVQALTAKFQEAFLEAYEKGDLPPLNYDDIENYDWAGLISWTTQLETHEDVDLPGSRQALQEQYHVEDVGDEATDWRETWFATTSTYNRLEAVASETMSIPLPLEGQRDSLVLERARTWVRSICCTSLKGVNVKEKLVPKLLELGDGDVNETNRILQKIVSELNADKVITRTKGKGLGGNFRIHGMFAKQLEKMASTAKFRQAIVFKTQLDEVFRRGEEFIMPYASDDGSIMAVLNLQAHGRIRNTTVDMPNIPFGFEPGNYEGRTFPKSYYHFKIRLAPTETYLFNDDMALLKQAHLMGPPTQGPGEKIPIWVDFFGKVNAARWADYVSMIVSTLAIKGPMAPAMCVTLLKPLVEEFELQLIIDWLDKLGLVQQAVAGCGVTAAEWWWLVAGDIVQASDKTRLETEE